MTPEQIQQLVDTSAPMVANPTAWADLTPEQQDVFRLLMPRPFFDDDQRFYLSLWWLPVTSETLDDLRALMPQGHSLLPRDDGNGALFLGADLLSDALDGGPLAALLPVLSALPLTYLLPDQWPVIPSEPEPQEP